MKAPGKPETFSADQNRALRAGLRDYVAGQPGLSQSTIARMLGVSQQTAGLYLRDEVGFSYPSGTEVARLLGFGGVDAFFVAHGVACGGAGRG